MTVTTAGGTSTTSAGDEFTYVAAPMVTAISPTSGPADREYHVIVTGTNLTRQPPSTSATAAGTGHRRYRLTRSP